MFNLNYLSNIQKKELIILLLLLFFLLLPRILAYPILGFGIISTDAEVRYFPQVEKLEESFLNFFNQTGGLYSLFLLFSQKIFGNMIAGPVFIQHLIGIISALLVFYYFRWVNLSLAFIVTIFSFSNPIALWVEHTVLRESLVSFFLILLIILLTLAVKKEKYFRMGFAFLAGILGLILVSLRIEFLILIILIPLVLFIAKKRKEPKLKIRDKFFLSWSLGYYLPFLIIFIILVILPQKPELGTSYNSYFNIAYHSLQAETFYYQDSQYPELLEKYQEAVEKNKTVHNSMATLYQETEKYLSAHPEINLSMLAMMDKIYLEIMTKNNLSYQRSVVINLKNHLLGITELKTLLTRFQLTGNYLADEVLRFFSLLMLVVSWLIFLLFLPALPFFFIKWKSLPNKVIIAFLISAIHILVLTFIADPTHRFRYALDPFIYFSQLYLIMILIQTLISKFKLFQQKYARFNQSKN